MKIKDLPKIERPREKLEKKCVICGGRINVIHYADRTYRGGHYFGKLLNNGKDEYWECPKCYWKRGD